MTQTTEISATEVARQPGLILDRASRGEVFMVTRYGRPYAVISPPQSGDQDGSEGR